jgi:DNA topoisomerase I
VTLRSGRFGPYVTDGTTNASLRRGDNMDDISIERASELLADRRAAGPSQKRAKKAAKTTKAAKASKTTKKASKAAKAAKATKAAKAAAKSANPSDNT